MNEPDMNEWLRPKRDRINPLAVEVIDTLIRSKCNNHEVLTALVVVSARCVTVFADDDGAKLRDLETQFCEQLHQEVMSYDHSADYHGEIGHG